MKEKTRKNLKKVDTAYKKYRKIKAVFSVILILLFFVAIAGFAYVLITGLPKIGQGIADSLIK